MRESSARRERSGLAAQWTQCTEWFLRCRTLLLSYFAVLHARRFFPSLKDVTVTLDIPEEMEAQFTAAARARGVALSDYPRDFIVEHYQEDADDLRIARERLADPQPGIASSKLRKNLGLDG